MSDRFEFLLDDIGRATDDQLRARALNAFGVLALLFLRDARMPGRFASAFAHWSDLLSELNRAPDAPRALMVLFRYLAKALDESAWPTVRRTAHGILQENEETFMATMAERWLREGREQGVQQGREEGLEQGQRALLIELLETKFGKLDEQVLRRLEAADALARKRYAQRILTATTLDEVFAAES